MGIPLVLKFLHGDAMQKARKRNKKLLLRGREVLTIGGIFAVPLPLHCVDDKASFFLSSFVFLLSNKLPFLFEV